MLIKQEEEEEENANASANDEFEKIGLSFELKKLISAWLNEQGSPIILNYETNLVNSILKSIENQKKKINERNEKLRNLPQEQFCTRLYQMEISRIEYILQNYLKIRIEKIQNYSLYIISNTEILKRLSRDEILFAEKYCDLFGSHLNSTFLSLLPEGKLQSLTETDEKQGINMISTPNLNQYVFIKVLQDIGEYQFSDDGTDDNDIIVDLKKNDLYLLRFKSIQSLLNDNIIELV